MECDTERQRDATQNLPSDNAPRPIYLAATAQGVEPPYEEGTTDDRQKEDEDVHPLLGFENGFIYLEDNTDDGQNQDENGGCAETGGHA